ESQTAIKPACTPGFLAKSITCSGQIIAIDQSLPNSSRTTIYSIFKAAFSSLFNWGDLHAREGCDVAAHAARTHRAPVPGRASASGRRLRPNLRDVGKQKLQSYFQRSVGCVAQGPAPPAVVKEVAASVVQGIELLCLVVTDQLPDL